MKAKKKLKQIKDEEKRKEGEDQEEAKRAADLELDKEILEKLEPDPFDYRWLNVIEVAYKLKFPEYYKDLSAGERYRKVGERLEALVNAGKLEKRRLLRPRCLCQERHRK